MLPVIIMSCRLKINFLILSYLYSQTFARNSITPARSSLFKTILRKYDVNLNSVSAVEGCMEDINPIMK